MRHTTVAQQVSGVVAGAQVDSLSTVPTGYAFDRTLSAWLAHPQVLDVSFYSIKDSTAAGCRETNELLKLTSTLHRHTTTLKQR